MRMVWTRTSSDIEPSLSRYDPHLRVKQCPFRAPSAMRLELLQTWRKHRDGLFDRPGPDGTRFATSCLATAPEPTFPDGITRLLALPEELHIRHDRLVRMVGSPMRDVGVVVGNADHQARRSSGPINGRARCPRGAIEQ